MLPSADALKLIKASEGLRLTAYRDSVGVWTIGYGHTSGVKAGQTCTIKQAEDWLDEDADDAGKHVSKLVTVPLTQGQFDALVDFVFNLGAGRLAGSTLLRLLNRGLYDQAANQFQYWVMAGGHPLPGLVKRRAAEKALFLSRNSEAQNVGTG